MTRFAGGVEAGGTKFVCAVGTPQGEVLAEERFPTTDPQSTLGRVIAFFETQQAALGAIDSLGIGSFGPIELRCDSPTFGYITATPKPGWSNTDVVGRLHSALDVPVAFDTDVNAAGLGEWQWGAARGLSNFVYLTVGTGIGGGGMINGALIHGLVHPEMGHVRIPHDRQRDPFAGCCPFHGDCLEGLASGPALAERWGAPTESLAADHPAWELEAEYLALALVNFICTLSPERIVLGGGVMQQEGLYQRVREKVLECLNNYVRSPAIIDAIDDFIVPPALGNRAGVLGAIALGQRLLQA